MKKIDIILIGGGGHCKSAIDVIEQEDKYNIIGIIDLKEKVGQEIYGYPIIGSDEDLEFLGQKNDYFLITIGQVKYSKARKALYEKLKSLKKHLPVIASPRAYVSEHSIIGEGTIIMHDVIVNASVEIGVNCIINNKSLIEHDTIIGNHCHISTNTVINGECVIGNDSFLGSSSVLNNGITVSNNTVIGSGSVIINNIDKENEIWVGNPAKLKKNK